MCAEDCCFINADLTLSLVLSPAAKIISISSVLGIEMKPLLHYKWNKIMPEYHTLFCFVSSYSTRRNQINRV